MAIRTQCENCKKPFSAQDDYLGRKIKCPNCGTKTTVRSLEEHVARDEWRREQEERLGLLEALDERDRKRSAQTAFGNELASSVAPVRNFNPGAVTRFRKLRALSSFMLLGAYLMAGIVIAGAGIVVTMFVTGALTDALVLALALTGAALLLFGLYFVFKFMGEFAWLLADVGDHQLDVRNLLLDLREDLDRLKARNAGAIRRAREDRTAER